MGFLAAVCLGTDSRNWFGLIVERGGPVIFLHLSENRVHDCSLTELYLPGSVLTLSTSATENPFHLGPLNRGFVVVFICFIIANFWLMEGLF